MSMKEIGAWALNVCNARGVQFADLRIVDERNRGLATKNGKVATAADSDSMGIGVRVLANGAWGFAATEDLTRAGVETTAAQAVEIARASAQVKEHDVVLAPEKAHVDDWSSAYKSDPFGISVEQNLELLMKIDAELLKVKGITLAETNMNFRRYEQWYYSSDGADIHQVKVTTGAGYGCMSYARKEIQKR